MSLWAWVGVVTISLLVLLGLCLLAIGGVVALVWRDLPPMTRLDDPPV